MNNHKSKTIQRVLALKKRLYGVQLKGGSGPVIPQLRYNDYSATDFSRETYKGGRRKKGKKSSTRKQLGRKKLNGRSRRQTRRQRGGNMLDLLRNSAMNVSAHPVGGVYTSNGVLVGDSGRLTGNQFVDPSPYNQPINNFSKA